MEELLQKEIVERRRQENNVRRLRGALRHLLADGENLDCADPHRSHNKGPEERPGHETKLESSYCCSCVGTPEQVSRDGIVFSRDSVARPHVADARDSHGNFELADRLGHRVAFGAKGGSDLVAVTAAAGK